MAQVSIVAAEAEDKYALDHDIQSESGLEDLANDSSWDSDVQNYDWDSDRSDVDATPARPAKRIAVNRDKNANFIDLTEEPSLSVGGTMSTPTIAAPVSLMAAALCQYSHDTAALSVQVMELFPDICHEYLKGLLSRYAGNISHTEANVASEKLMATKEMVVEEILANPSYPKKQLKRKREETKDDAENKKWTSINHDGELWYQEAATYLLGDMFPFVPDSYIRQILREKKNLFSACQALSTAEHAPAPTRRPYDKLKRARVRRHRDIRLDIYNHPAYGELQMEVKDAKLKLARDAELVHDQKRQEEAERRNQEQHARAGTLVECQCCYSDVPPNRAITCEGENVHFFCFSCIRKSAETQIGLMKYQLQCFDTSGCQAGFPRSEIKEVLGSSMMAKLDALQQQDEISRASIEGLESCPFCEFKAICPPVDEDREFRCCNPSCEVVSCRLCKDVTHVPKTCEEAKKDRGVSERHLVEEAMSEALIRNCPRCKVKIVKEFGCNKMTCPSCRCCMCYLCKKDITREQYAHFGYGPNACTVEDDPMRDQKEVEQAQKKTIEEIRAENPGLNSEELQVKLPEANNTNQRRDRARAPFHFHREPAFNVIMQAQRQARLEANQQRALERERRNPFAQAIDEFQGFLDAIQFPAFGYHDMPNAINNPLPVGQPHHLNAPVEHRAPAGAGLAAIIPGSGQPAGTGLRNDPFLVDDPVRMNQNQNQPAGYAPYDHYFPAPMPAPAQRGIMPPAPHHLNADPYGNQYIGQQPLPAYRNDFYPFF
ncbi:E3 ubiquitin-protein ligase RNF216 [Aspergillus novofumigatus IBT 16806]|uniref:Putative RING finger protein n=1 Tax=Aspergillus novofumigatus (strain IBT 16806) TaxID=1392255 RepID=A0A2I1CP56_ASPN1|nr:putative RING finger protein [Aspergillus novofumigatus IBT 16806]PKX99417.1 putative RING finger protein [Aspergillus novofumigatus IBT 16806]